MKGGWRPGAGIAVVLGLFVLGAGWVRAAGPALPEEVPVQGPSHCLTPDEAGLAELLNGRRKAAGLPPVPVSWSLTEVAKAHVFDLEVNGPDRRTDPRGLPCSLHSWSEAGPWSAVCYTRDHRNAEGMWRKPAELTGGLYPGIGVEIAYWRRLGVTAERAAAAWRDCRSHDQVVLEQGPWKGVGWKAMGVALSVHYAAVWFGTDPDPQGGVGVCSEDPERFLRGIAAAVNRLPRAPGETPPEPLEGNIAPDECVSPPAVELPRGNGR